ncbi:MAG TPA: VOC family protein [Candidatus Levybacteria bacterium]|nr:VOC family protein [Candidatus Levybacteria bacterium]
MNSSLAHIQVNVDFANISFYKDIMNFLGWKELYADDAMAGYAGENGLSVWFSQAPEGGSHNPSTMGLSHIGIQTDTLGNVDKVVTYLKDHGIQTLHNTPAHRPEFSSEGQTYYQVIFESPDKILFEVMYAGQK